MIINFGLNNSPKVTLEKSVIWPEDGQKTGTLKENTSVINPVILVKGVSHLFDSYNYFYVPAFKRYYFITDIVSVRKGLVEISGHCDVLSSAGNRVKEQYAIVETSQSYFNTLLNDGSFKTYQDRYVINDFKFPYSFETPGDYVLALAGS